jgi:AraC family transcriptional regulator of arabinose operon
VWRARGIGDWLLWYTYAGACRISARSGDGKAATIMSGAGDAVLIAPRTPHDYGSAPGAARWAVQWVVFRPPAAWMEVLAWPESAPGIARMAFAQAEVRAAFRERLAAAIALASSPLAQRDRLAMNALEAALVWCSVERQGARQDPRLHKALAHLAAHLERSVPLDEVAAVAGVSRPQIVRLFRRHVGASPARWHEDQRIDRARQLLRATDLPVAAIAERIGFANAFHFSTRFARRTGRSPRAYRRG